MSNLWMQIGQTSGARIYGLAASLAGTFITARYLGPEGRGVVAAAIGWVTLFAILFGVSISQVVVFIASGRAEREWLAKTLTSVLSIVTMATVVGWTAAVVCAAVAPVSMFQHVRGPELLLAFALLPLMMWNESASSILVALGSIESMNLSLVAGATMGLLAVVLFVAGTGWGVYGALLAAGAYQITVATVTMDRIARRARAFELDVTFIRSLLGGGLRVHVNAITGFMIMPANVLLLNAFRPSAETGYYHLATQLIGTIQMFSVAVGMVATSLVTREGPDRAWPRQRRLLLQSCGISAGLSVAGILLAPLIVWVLAGETFMPAVPILRILLLGFVGLHFSTVMSSQWMGRGMFLRVSLLSFGVGVVSTIANCLVIPRHGAIGSAWVTSAVCGFAIVTNGAMALWVNARSEARRGQVTPA